MIPFNDILDAVAFECDCQVRDLVSRGRHRRLVLGRELVVELARRHTVMSYPEIADGLGRKSHSVAVGYAISPHGWYATGCDVHLAAAGHVEPVSTKQAFAYESLAEAIEETWFYNLRVWLSERMGEVEHKTRCDQAQRLFSLSRDAVERLCHGPDQPGLFETADNKARLVRNHWNPEVVHLSKPDGRPVPGGASFYHDWDAAIADARKLGWDVESEAPA